jgi:crotonobetaine/carnitine-CoA ligase
MTLREFPRYEPRFAPEQWTLSAVLEHHAAQHGKSAFLQWTDENEPLSFAETNARVNRLAHGFRQLGIERGEVVAFLLPNSLDYILAWFALNKLGAVEAPINPDYRGAFLEHQINISNATTLILGSELTGIVSGITDRLPAVRRMIVWPGTEMGCIASAGSIDIADFGELWADRGDNPDVVVAPQDPAAIMFTSGTTGLSKGVIMPHAQLYFFAEQCVQFMQLTSDDVYMTGFPFFHANAQVLSVYASLVAGARCTLYERFSAGKWVDRLRASGATVTNLLGATISYVLGQPPSPRDSDHRLRRIFAVPTPIDMLPAFQARFGVGDFVEGYGQTETCHPIMVPPGEPRPQGSCGVAVSQWYDLRIVDPETDLDMPEGSVGELVIRHRHPWTINSGYVGMDRASLDARRNMWFHTGDALRRDAEGWYYFVDRYKDALRRRGENVSSYEVEEVVRSHPSVDDVAVIAIPASAEAGEDDIKICVVLNGGPSVTASELLTWCDSALPRAMGIRYVEFVAALPVTANGKVEKHRLRNEQRESTTWDREVSGPAWPAAPRKGSR